MASRKGETVGVEFKPATGGIISTTHMRFKRGGQGGGPDFDHEHEEAVHPTMEHAVGHLRTTLGGVFGKSETEPVKGESAKEEPSGEE